MKPDLVALNRDHHRRMAALAKVERGKHDVKDAESRAHLLTAVHGCVHRYSMRRAGVAEVLELGAGSGRDRSVLEQELYATYTGIDVVPEVAERVGARCCSVEELPDEWAGRFDFVYSRHVMEHVSDPDLALRQIKKVLAPNGVVAAVTPHFFPDPEPAHITKLRVQDWMTRYQLAGLRPVFAVVKPFAVAEAHIVAVHEEWREPVPETTFRVGEQELPYFNHPYNETRKNERAVEVPVVLQLFAHAHAALVSRRGADNVSVLEVGNVLSHYAPGMPARRIVDKYEKAPGVENADVLALNPDLRKYDLIVSISTLEHVGVDEDDKDARKAVRAAEHLRACLDSEGLMLLTVPLGYNAGLDAWVDALPPSFVHYMRRVDAAGNWEQVERAAAKDAQYGKPFPFANVVAFAVVPADGAGDLEIPDKLPPTPRTVQ